MDQSIQANLATTEKKTYSGTALRVMKLLGAGCTQTEAAKACGCVDGYVSQLMKETSFREQVNDIVTKTMAEQSKIDEHYNDVELLMSRRLKETCEHIYDPDKVLRILKFTNEAKRRIAPITNTSGVNGSDGTPIKPVVLILPLTVASEFILNPQNEVVGVNGKELTTLPSARINNLIEKHKDEIAGRAVKLIKNGSGQTDPYSDL